MRNYPTGYKPSHGLAPVPKMTVGESVGWLTLVSTARRYGGKARGIFRCACGNELILYVEHVKNGSLSSCGCSQG